MNRRVTLPIAAGSLLLLAGCVVQRTESEDGVEFHYNIVFLLLGVASGPIALLAWYLLKKKRRGVAWGLFGLGIVVPLWIVPWYFDQRFEITKDGVAKPALIPLFTRSFQFDEVQNVRAWEVAPHQELGALEGCYDVQIIKKDGSDLRIRFDTHLDVAAAEEVWQALRKRGIPLTIETLEEQRKKNQPRP